MTITCTNPTAKISVKKNVLKEYQVKGDNSVYLSNGTEFEIELFNPTKDEILAKIYLNGKLSSQKGLVLRPGERIFLDRSLDQPKKYKFDIYSVDNNEITKNAIRNNGELKVEFFKEHTLNWLTSGSGTITISDPLFWTGTPSIGTTTIDTTTIGTTTTNVAPFTYTSGNGTISDCKSKSIPSIFTCSSIETGRIESGGLSNQDFDISNTNFQIYPFHTKVVKILPESQKNYTSDDIKHKNYCPECGSKVKSTHKFCAQCGEKL